MTFDTILNQLIQISIYSYLFYIAVSFFFWTVAHETQQESVQDIEWQDTCLQWMKHKEYWNPDECSYYDLLASFVPKTDTYTMTQTGILDIGNGGLKRSLT